MVSISGSGNPREGAEGAKRQPCVDEVLLPMGRREGGSCFNGDIMIYSSSYWRFVLPGGFFSPNLDTSWHLQIARWTHQVLFFVCDYSWMEGNLLCFWHPPCQWLRRLHPDTGSIPSNIPQQIDTAEGPESPEDQEDRTERNGGVLSHTRCPKSGYIVVRWIDQGICTKWYPFTSGQWKINLYSKYPRIMTQKNPPIFETRKSHFEKFVIFSIFHKKIWTKVAEKNLIKQRSDRFFF